MTPSNQAAVLLLRSLADRLEKEEAISVKIEANLISGFDHFVGHEVSGQRLIVEVHHVPKKKDC